MRLFNSILLVTFSFGPALANAQCVPDNQGAEAYILTGAVQAGALNQPNPVEMDFTDTDGVTAFSLDTGFAHNAQATVAVDLSTGKIAYFMTSVPLATDSSSVATANGFWFDRVCFNLPDNMPTADIDVVLNVTGSISCDLGEYSCLFPGTSPTFLQFDSASVTVPFVDLTLLADQTTIDHQIIINATVIEGVTYPIQALTTVATWNGGAIDFSNTIGLQFVLPEGVSFESASGELLSATDPTQPIPLTACGTLDVLGATYVLQNDINNTGGGTCFTITEDNITLDFNSHSLTGGSRGIQWKECVNGSCDAVDNIVVKNGTIENVMGFGIFSFDSSGSTIENMNFVNSYMRLNSYKNSVVRNSVFTEANPNGTNRRFVQMDGSSRSNVIENNSFSGGIAADLFFVTDNIFANNTVDAPDVGFRIGESSKNNTFTNNNVTAGNLAIESAITSCFIGSGWPGPCENFLVYENVNGSISWTDSTFLLDLDVPSPLTFPGSLVIDYNLASVDESQLSGGILSEARITLNNIPGTEAPAILRDDVPCVDCALVSFENSSVEFDVTGFSSYSVLLATNDGDSDGIPDDDDLCLLTSVGDEVDASGCSVAQVDVDADGWCDIEAPSSGPNNCVPTDNCPTVPNPGQIDDNNDGFGDACVDPSVTIPPNADVDPTATVGADTDINKNVTVGADSSVGSNVVLNRGVSVGDGVDVGDGAILNKNSEIGDGASVGAGVTISQGVYIGPGAVIGDFAFIGRDSVICDGATIGNNATLNRNIFVEIEGTVAASDTVPKNTVIAGEGACAVP